MHRILIILISLTLLSCTLVAVDTLIELKGEDIRQQRTDMSITEDNTRNADDSPAVALHKLKKTVTSRIILLMGLIMGALLSGMGLYFRWVVKSLKTLRRTAEAISAGKLNLSVRTTPPGPFGKLSEIITEIAVNQQEILLHIWNHCRQASTILDTMTQHHGHSNETDPADSAKPHHGLLRIQGHMQEIQAIVTSFDFYDVQLNGGRMVRQRPSPEQAELN